MFPFRGYLFLSWHLTHRGGGRIFAVFCGKKKNAFFRPGQSFCSKQFQKSDFWGESSVIYVMFFNCAFWFVHDFRRTVRKNGIFSCPKSVQKMPFFRVRKNGAFWLQRKAAGFVP